MQVYTENNVNLTKDQLQVVRFEMEPIVEYQLKIKTKSYRKDF